VQPTPAVGSMLDPTHQQIAFGTQVHRQYPLIRRAECRCVR
jgi:hypothetical protein